MARTKKPTVEDLKRQAVEEFKRQQIEDEKKQATKDLKHMADTLCEELKSVRLELPLETHKAFRIEAAKEYTSMAAIARQLVEEWLSKRKAGGK